MTSTHMALILLIILVAWTMGMIRLAPRSNKKIERELIGSIIKKRKGIFK